jgi:hypothetical protein
LIFILFVVVDCAQIVTQGGCEDIIKVAGGYLCEWRDSSCVTAKQLSCSDSNTAGLSCSETSEWVEGGCFINSTTNKCEAKPKLCEAFVNPSECKGNQAKEGMCYYDNGLCIHPNEDYECEDIIFDSYYDYHFCENALNYFGIVGQGIGCSVFWENNYICKNRFFFIF